MPPNFPTGAPAPAHILSPLVSAERCGTCKFHRPHGPAGAMHCMRMPPVVIGLPELQAMIPPGQTVETSGGARLLPGGGLQLAHLHMRGAFPHTEDDTWCGEWKPRFLGTDGARIS